MCKLVLLYLLTWGVICSCNQQTRYKNLLLDPVDSVKLIATDYTIEKSNFAFYEGRYAIYFQRNRVVAFCDSVLNSLPPYQKEIEGEIDSLWAVRFGFEYLRDNAEKNSRPDKRSDFLHTLFTRFHPLVIDTVTDDIPPFMMIVKEHTRTAYRVVSPALDTTDLAYSNYMIFPASIEFVK